MNRQDFLTQLIKVIMFTFITSFFHSIYAAQNGSNIKNYGVVKDQVLYRGAEPPLEAYAWMKQVHFKTVVNLIDGNQDAAKAAAEAQGLKWVHLPLEDNKMPPEAILRQWEALYSDPSNYPIFIHCEGGRHRTGGMVFFYRVNVDGWTNEQAYDEAKDYNFYAWRHEAWKKFMKGYVKGTY